MENKANVIIISVVIAIFLVVTVATVLHQINPKAVSAEISKSDAEHFCQDNALLSRYLDMKEVSVIDVLNYNSQYTDTGTTDSDGSKIMMLSWNGKVNDGTTGFVCNVSGTKDDIELRLLSVGGEDLYSKD